MPLLREVGRFDRAEFPSELDVGVCSNQMELTNGGFHHGQLHAVKSLVLEVGEEGIERYKAIVSDESLISDRCKWLTTNLRRR